VIAAPPSFSVKIGRLWRFARGEVEAWLKEQGPRRVAEAAGGLDAKCEMRNAKCEMLRSPGNRSTERSRRSPQSAIRNPQSAIRKRSRTP
jgi:hypothetical protein